MIFVLITTLLLLFVTTPASAHSPSACVASSACQSAIDAAVAKQKADDDLIIQALRAKIASLESALAACINSGGSTCPEQPPSSATIASLWPTSFTPAMNAGATLQAVELGVVITPLSNGLIHGLKFYRTSSEQGTQTGRLWTSEGTKLGEVTFPIGLGWVQATFAQPIAVVGGLTYVASYYAPSGWEATAGYWTQPYTANDLTATSGVYAYGSAPSFPRTAYTNNYWIDVLYERSSDNTSSNVLTILVRSPVTAAAHVGASVTVRMSVPGGDINQWVVNDSGPAISYAEGEWTVLTVDGVTDTFDVTFLATQSGTARMAFQVIRDSIVEEYPLVITVLP